MKTTILINALATVAIVFLSTSCSKDSSKYHTDVSYPAAIQKYASGGNWQPKEIKEIKWNWSRKPLGRVWPGKRKFILPESTLEILNPWHPVMLGRVEEIKKQNNCSSDNCSVTANIPNSRKFDPWTSNNWKYVMFYNPKMRHSVANENFYIDYVHELHMRAIGSFIASNKLPVETYAIRISSPNPFNSVGGALQGWDSCNGDVDYSAKAIHGVYDKCNMLNDYLWFNGKSEDNSDFVKWFNLNLLGLNKIVFKNSPLYVIVNSTNEIEYVIAPPDDIDSYNQYRKENTKEDFNMIDWAPELTWTNSSNPYHHISFLKTLFNMDDKSIDMNWLKSFYTDSAFNQITYPIGIEENTNAIRELQKTATEVIGAAAGQKK